MTESELNFKSPSNPPTKIWSVYMSEADRQDRALAFSWKADMDALLIFAGLFSATITAFIIESYKTLTPDPADATLAILTHISLQIAAISNGTQAVTLPPSLPQSQPPLRSLLCNAFWFLSLAFSLICALAATLVDQWARNYLTATSATYVAPHKRARIRAYLYGGLQRFRIKTVVETIPTLLHISLLLFFAGLVEFLSPINSTIRTLIIVILVICVALYTITTLLPLFSHDCPYWTPFSGVCWWAIEVLRKYAYHCRNRQLHKHVSLSLTQYLAATTWSPARDQRDEDALLWTLQSLTEPTEFEPFVEGIVGFLSDQTTAITTMQRLLVHPDIKLGARIIWLLRQARYQDGPEKTRSTITCLTALWSLITCCWEPQARIDQWFDDETFPVLEMLRYDGPITAHYLSSTTALFLMRLFDQFSLTATSIEQEPRDAEEGDVELWNEQKQAQKYILNTPPQISSGCIMSMKAWLKRIEHTALVDKVSANRRGSSLPITSGLPQSLRSFRTMVNEARINVFNDYVGELLSDQPPFEAWDTFYDITLDPESNVFPVSFYNQSRLVTLLEGITKLPMLAAGHLLDLVAILDDPELIKRARRTVADYVASYPDNVSASKALAVLQESPSPNPTLNTVPNMHSEDSL